MGDAVQLVSFGGNKQLELHSEGLRSLQLFSCPLSVLSVVGPSRHGKYVFTFTFTFPSPPQCVRISRVNSFFNLLKKKRSTLCNVILQALGVNTAGRKLFSVGGGSTPITSGIWVCKIGGKKRKEKKKHPRKWKEKRN